MTKKPLLLVMLLGSVFVQVPAAAFAQTTTTLYSVADAYPDSKYPNSAYGKRPILYVGNSYDRGQDIWGSERIYIRFDLTQLPKHRLITKATLILWQFFAPDSDQRYEAHRVTARWNEETINWKNQPRWDPEISSVTVAPARAEVPVEWDITNDVRAWYAGETPNFGVMMKAVEEGNVAGASSGFWSREYPAEEWVPRLVVLTEIALDYGYPVSVNVKGLPAGVNSTVMVDGVAYDTVTSASEEQIRVDNGVHNVTVARVIPVAEGVRYECDQNQIHVSGPTSIVFEYAPEFYAAFSSDPDSLFEKPADGWYREGTVATLKRLGGDMINLAPSARMVFDGWYVNSHKLNCTSCHDSKILETIVSEPLKVQGRYRTEYYVNVTSSYGEVQGSGWYPAGTVAFFSIDTSAIPVEGPLGLLGLKHSFTGWIGSDYFQGLQVNPAGSLVVMEPTAIEATWEEDWSSLILNLLIVVAVTLACIVVVFRVRIRSLTATGRLKDKQANRKNRRAVRARLRWLVRFSEYTGHPAQSLSRKLGVRCSDTNGEYLT